MKNYFYVAVVAVAALLLVVSLRTIFAFQGPGEAPPAGNGQLAADGDNVGLGTTSPSKLFDLAKANTAVQMVFKRMDDSISANNTLGRINFTGTDGATEASPHIGSFIQGSASGGNWNSDQSPGNLSFYTTPTGSVSPAKRMTIYQDGLVEFKGHIEIEGGSPAKGKFLQSSTNGGRVKWDYWPGDHLWGQGRSGIELEADSNGECTRALSTGDLKIARSVPPVKWEGATAACPKGWWVCTADERGTGICGTTEPVKKYTIKTCYPSFSAISSRAVDVRHYPSNAKVTIYDLDSSTLVSGTYQQTDVIDAWVADAFQSGNDGLYYGKAVSVNGKTFEGPYCTILPAWCCAYQ